MDAMNFDLVYEKHSDVLYVNIVAPVEGTRVDVVDISEQVGFPGLVLARVSDAGDGQILYGLTIQNYSEFKKAVRWKYRMLSVKLALELIVKTVRAGFCLEHRTPVRAYA